MVVVDNIFKCKYNKYSRVSKKHMSINGRRSLLLRFGHSIVSIV